MDWCMCRRKSNREEQDGERGIFVVKTIKNLLLPINKLKSMFK